MTESSEVLLVSPTPERWERHLHLNSPLNIHRVSTANETRQALQNVAGPCVVVTEISLPDGNWLSVLRDVLMAGVDAELIVVSDADDNDFRMVVCAYGAYDLVVPEQEQSDLARTIVHVANRLKHRPYAAALDLGRRS